MGPEQSPVYIKNSEDFLSLVEIGISTNKWKVYGKKFSECLPEEIVDKNLLKIKKGKTILDFLNIENEEVKEHFTNELNFLPCLVEADEDVEIEILSASGSSIYLKPLGKIKILGKELIPNNQKAYKLSLTTFERSASRSEWCGHKSISDLITDASDEFIQVITSL